MHKFLFCLNFSFLSYNTYTLTHYTVKVLDYTFCQLAPRAFTSSRWRVRLWVQDLFGACLPIIINKCGGPFLQCWAGLPTAILDPSVLSKRVETGPTVTHFGPACAQTMPRLPRTSFTCPWQAELLRMSYGKQI